MSRPCWLGSMPLTLSAPRRDGIVGRPRPSPYQATIPGPTQVGGAGRGPGVRSAREPVRIARAEIWIRRPDRARGARERRSRSRSGDDAADAARPSRCGSPSRRSRSIMLPLLGRRRFPFAAPAAACGCWPRRCRSSTGGWSPSRPASPSPGMAAALLLGHLRDDVQARLGPRDRDRRRGDHRLQRPDHAAGEFVFTPGPVRDRLARRLRAARAGRAGRGGGGPRGAGRARARDGRAASQSPRSARGSRASCTTSSPTRSA